MEKYYLRSLLLDNMVRCMSFTVWESHTCLSTIRVYLAVSHCK